MGEFLVPACADRRPPDPRGGRRRDPHHSERRTRGDRGQAAVVVVSVVAVLLVIVAVAVAALGRNVIDRTRAQTAADAAALASLEGGSTAASELAARHGATVTSWSASGFEVVVTVRVGATTATARASNAP